MSIWTSLMEWPEVQLPHQFHLKVLCGAACRTQASTFYPFWLCEVPKQGTGDEHGVLLTAQCGSHTANASVLMQTFCPSRHLARLCRERNTQLGFLAVARFLSGIFNSDA